MTKSFILLLLLNCFFKSPASTIDKAYKALHEYDYFKAKKLFYSQLKKNTTEAAFGLATIYSRNDNSFYKLDSSYKYILICRENYKNLSPEKTLKLKTNFHLNDSCIEALHDSICQKAYFIFLNNST